MDDLRDRLAEFMWDLRSHSFGWHELSSQEQRQESFEAESILAEIAKTHRLVKLDGGPHGTYSRYTNGRCRCDLCREANRERGRRYRKEIKERENE